MAITDSDPASKKPVVPSGAMDLGFCRGQNALVAQVRIQIPRFARDAKRIDNSKLGCFGHEAECLWLIPFPRQIVPLGID